MPSSQQPMAALDSLRTVEFRQTLRGYHIDDVDEYLERVAVEAEALQEQLRQSAERMRQATDRIAQLEGQRAQAPLADDAPAAVGEGSDTDALQRTLTLAQRFVEQTEAEAKADARRLLEDAQQRARDLVAEAEGRARQLAEDAERRLREEVARLESQRTALAADVEAITKHLETERARLRGALGEMLHWIEDKFESSPPPKAATTGGAAAAPVGSTEEGRPERPSLASALQPVGQANAPNGLPH